MYVLAMQFVWRCFANQQSIRKRFYSTYYVTTPIFYVNAAPHIGHLYTAVLADAICRFRRLQDNQNINKNGDNICLSTGTDEHGSKVQKAASLQQISNTADYCQKISDRYKEVFRQALVQHSDFVRTTEERHRRAVEHFWRTLRDRQHIYLANYSGWYSVADETYLTESQLRHDEETGIYRSLESGHPVEWTEEQNYMFALSSFQSDIMYWLKQNERRVRPKKFGKIVLDMLNEPLADLSVSRPTTRVPWAIPVPDDDTQTVYVWLDALVNYLTSVGYPERNFSSMWPPKVQVIGKDILKFHAIYWPAFLIAAGLEPPQEIFVHSHWTVDGQKMSKSKNNVIDPFVAAETFSMEGLRYFLLREGVPHSDGNYNSVKAMRILNAELADTLGNLLSRVCAKSLNPRQIYPRIHKAPLRVILQTENGQNLMQSISELPDKCYRHYEENNFYLVADAVMTTLHQANSFFEFSRPWELKLTQKLTGKLSSDKKHHSPMALIVRSQSDENLLRLETIIAMTMDTLRVCGIALQPLLPELTSKLLDKLNVPAKERQWINAHQHFVGIFNDNLEPVLEVNLRSTNSVLFKRLCASKENDDETVTTTIKIQCKGYDQQSVNEKQFQKGEYSEKQQLKSKELQKEQQLIKNRQSQKK